jgi:hypothetical protein
MSIWELEGIDAWRRLLMTRVYYRGVNLSQKKPYSNVSPRNPTKQNNKQTHA